MLTDNKQSRPPKLEMQAVTAAVTGKQHKPGEKKLRPIPLQSNRRENIKMLHKEKLPWHVTSRTLAHSDPCG